MPTLQVIVALCSVALACRHTPIIVCFCLLYFFILFLLGGVGQDRFTHFEPSQLLGQGKQKITETISA